MAHTERTQINTKQIAKVIRTSAKRVIAKTDLNTSTRKGNKELDFIVKRMAGAQSLTPADAELLGKALGEQILTLSQRLGRTNLDHGVLHQLAVSGQLPSLDGAQTDSQPFDSPKTPSNKTATPEDIQTSESKGKTKLKDDTGTREAEAEATETEATEADTNAETDAKQEDNAELAVASDASSSGSDNSEDEPAITNERVTTDELIASPVVDEDAAETESESSDEADKATAKDVGDKATEDVTEKL